MSRQVTTPIELAVESLRDEPRRALEATLKAFAATRGTRSDDETEEYLDVLAQAVLAVTGARADSPHDPVETMLTEPRAERLAIATLLRLLAHDDDAFRDFRLRQKGVTFLDRQLAAKVYADVGLKSRDQNFEKLKRLRGAVEDHERRFAGHLESLETLHTMAAFRQELAGVIRAPLSQIMIWPFLWEGFAPNSLNEMLTAAARCDDASDDDVLGESEQCQRVLDTFRERAGRVQTGYGDMVVGLADRAAELVHAQLRDRGLVEGADLSLTKRQKTYPLHVCGARVVVRFELVNSGPGQARDVEVEIESDGSVRFNRLEQHLGLVAPGTRIVEFAGDVQREVTENGDVVIARWRWRNADGTQQEREVAVDLMSQPTDVDWDALDEEHPYTTDPVRDMKQFVGRDRDLKELVRITASDPPGNAIITGQRRVGKTSIANALRARVEEKRGARWSFLSVECGEFAAADSAASTIALLGERIVRVARMRHPEFSELPAPDFGRGLSPLTDFFERAGMVMPEHRFVLVLDEFDAMPQPELYDRGPVASSLFMTLRALGNRPNVAFVLIGGERMRFVTGTQGESLNQFRTISVDYFPEEHMDDYARLLRDPVEGSIDIDDEAVQAIYEASAGNPWITKLLGQQLFSRCVEHCDGDVRREDARATIARAAQTMAATDFQHFWDDGIVGDATERELVSRQRRRVLLAAAANERARESRTESAMVAAARRHGLDEVIARGVVRSFRERGILVEGESPDAIEFRIPVFASWLADAGVHAIVETLGDEDAVVRAQRAEEAARVKPEEVAPLADTWSVYQGRQITTDHIRAWLDQFGRASEQRLLLPLLEGITYYTNHLVRTRLSEIHAYVIEDLASRGVQYKFSGTDYVRRDLVACALDEGGSGATHLLKPYRDHRLVADHVVSNSRVPRVVNAAAGSINGIVVLDDFFATGQTARRRIRDLHEAWYGEGGLDPQLPVYFVAITGFDTAVSSLRSSLRRLGWDADVHVADPLGDEDRAFSEESRVYPEDADRASARALVQAKGEQLVPNNPLGFGDCQSLVVFETRCPNNSLPVLWSSGRAFEPLFPRL